MVNLKTAVALGLTVGPVAGLVAIEGGVVSGVIKRTGGRDLSATHAV